MFTVPSMCEYTTQIECNTSCLFFFHKKNFIEQFRCPSVYLAIYQDPFSEDDIEFKKLDKINVMSTVSLITDKIISLSQNNLKF